MSIAIPRRAIARHLLPALLVALTAAQCSFSKRISESEFSSGEANNAVPLELGTPRY